ncbi:MAG: transcriptional regulator, MarR family [Clostridia bacterium]|jgi:DNA-binding MarR family transcriptional regulator|nr:transcriptional regulator, MarR family [Clostridia bacterium]
MEENKGIKAIKILKNVMETVKQKVHSHFKEMNITGPQGMLMGTLAHHGEMKVSDLSERLGLSNSTVSGIIDRLENQGLVERTRSKEDRRVVYVNVSPEFRKNSKEHFLKIEKVFEAMMSKATPEELDDILQGLNTLQRVIDRDQK